MSTLKSPAENKMKIIGLTGPSGAGKSTVAALFSDRGIPVIDADAEYHALLLPPSPCLDALCAAFGSGILRSDGTLDRALLGALVFEDSETGRSRKQTLNTITHAYVSRRIEHRLSELAAAAYPAVVIDAPLLIEAGIHRQCDLTVCVLAPAALRAERLMQRDDRTKDAILARIQAQPADAFYLANTHAAIVNDASDPAALEDRVTELLHRVGVRA